MFNYINTTKKDEIFMSLRTLHCLLLLCLISFPSFAEPALVGKKVLYVSSYENTYEWSAGIARAIEDEFANTGVQLRHFYMDTKNHPAEAEKQAAALKAKVMIEEFKPDVVITSDDDAAKYLIVPYYKNSSLPFVFCGVNWDASQYGFPTANVTGMLEVDLADQLVKLLRDYAHGDRLGFIGLDGLSERKEATFYKSHLHLNLQKTYFVKTLTEFEQAFNEAQNEVDMLIIANLKGVHGFELEKAIGFVENKVRIPTGTTLHQSLAHLSLLSLVKLSSEQGKWVAQTALKILNGASPSDFPIAKNKEGKLILNTWMAVQLGVKFKPALLKLGTPVGKLEHSK
ncbi:MAG: hypothetical protein RL368_1754 [Pseudomonadota bacterium]|jgi:ABC-type uncharacterized transport system substrate-binding protein